jgi:hypothetical protein
MCRQMASQGIGSTNNSQHQAPVLSTVNTSQREGAHGSRTHLVLCLSLHAGNLVVQ